MKSIKCSNCGLVSYATQSICKRCGFSYTDNISENRYNSSGKTQNIAFSANFNSTITNESEIVKKDAWKKIKWGLLVSIVGFAITVGVINLGFFEGYSNTDREYLTRVKAFSLITLFPLAAVLAGIIELITGFSIFKIIEKWEELPHWLGWLIGIGAFFLIIFVILFVVAVIVFNFF